MTNKPIGIIDSGIGGLSVYREIVSLLPNEPVVYIGDNAQAPYGVLSEEDIYERSVELVSVLLEKDVKLIVVACNTITVCCIDKLRKTFPHVPMIGTVPVVKTAAAVTRNNKIGILSTTRTADSAYQKDLINKFASDKTVFNLGTDELVPLIEQGIPEGKQLEEILQRVLSELQTDHIDTLVLGCTHYPFITNEIQKVLGDGVQILDSGAAIARQVRRVLDENNALAEEHPPRHSFYTTGEASRIDRIAKKLLGATIASIPLRFVNVSV
jgi:glutamate racemase